MKKILFLLIGLIFIPYCYSQKIKVDEIDPFTKVHKVQTSMERLCSKRTLTELNDIINISLRNIDGTYTMPCNIKKLPMVKYGDKSGLFLLFENGETAFLPSMYTGIGAKEITGWGDGWFQTVLSIGETDIENLKSQKVTDVRLIYFSGHVDFKLKDKDGNKIKKMFDLIDKALNE